MSRENVEVVKSVLEPFQGLNAAEIDWGAESIREVLADKCSPELELRTLESGIGAGVDATYHGVDGLVRYLQDWLEPFSEYHSEWLDFIDQGDFVLVPNSNWGVGTGSGARVEIELAYACEVKDGLITRVLQYGTIDDAREAIKAST
jgi:SnoaL-like domain